MTNNVEALWSNEVEVMDEDISKKVKINKGKEEDQMMKELVFTYATINLSLGITTHANKANDGSDDMGAAVSSVERRLLLDSGYIDQ